MAQPTAELSGIPGVARANAGGRAATLAAASVGVPGAGPAEDDRVLARPGPRLHRSDDHRRLHVLPLGEPVEALGDGVDLVVVAAGGEDPGLVEKGVVPSTLDQEDVAGLDGGSQRVGPLNFG